MKFRYLGLMLLLLMLIPCLGQFLSYNENGDVVVTVIAVVGNEPILSLELDEIVRTSGMEIPKDSLEMLKVYGSLLSEMIKEKIVLQAARTESLDLDMEIIEKEFSARWDSFLIRFGSVEALAETLANEGLTIAEFKRQFKEQISNGIIKQTYIQKKLGFIEVSDKDVKEFFNDYQDSLPQMPGQFLLSVILISSLSDSTRWEIALKKTLEPMRQIKAGINFSKVAAEYSEDDISRTSGGNIGSFNLQDLPVSFKETVQKMKVGQFSDAVIGQRGYHIIKLFNRGENTVELAHIFLKLPDAESAAIFVANAVYDSAISGVEFSTLVKNHSDDSMSAQKGGELGWVSAEVFPNEILSLVDSAGIGAVIPPLLQPEGVAIYRIADIKESHQLKLEEDMDVIREFARQWKFNQKLDRIINNLKENIYVEIKDNRFKPYIK